jgi:hypothetical protein
VEREPVARLPAWSMRQHEGLVHKYGIKPCCYNSGVRTNLSLSHLFMHSVHHVHMHACVHARTLGLIHTYGIKPCCYNSGVRTNLSLLHLFMHSVQDVHMHACMRACMQ